ncbi:MAG: serine hydrolase domain-containing protein [Acidimicrobiales bacterium]
MTLIADLREVAEEIDFSGAARIEHVDGAVDEFAYGLADRARSIPNTVGTAFAVASGTKGVTALTAMSLVESGHMRLDDRVRDLIGDELPSVDAEVTIEQLLRHTSGAGDYLDESLPSDIDDHILNASAHTFERAADYLPLLHGHDQVSPPGTRFAYNNGGFVMLALAIERVLDRPFPDVATERVLEPAGISDGGFLRTDEPRANSAIGYLKGGRTNVFHLPVIGCGDGGIYLSLDDVQALWSAFLGGRIVSSSTVETMTTPGPIQADEGDRYGMGFWLPRSRPSVALEGIDAGVSFRTVHRVDRPSAGFMSWTVMSNTSEGVWPLLRIVERVVADMVPPTV